MVEKHFPKGDVLGADEGVVNSSQAGVVVSGPLHVAIQTEFPGFLGEEKARGLEGEKASRMPGWG